MEVQVGGYSARHTLVSILCLGYRASQLPQRSLKPSNARLEILNLFFLILARPVHVRQGHYGASRLVYLQPNVIRSRRDVLDLEGAICGELRWCGCCSWWLGG
jgi:hypothetical protein